MSKKKGLSQAEALREVFAKLKTSHPKYETFRKYRQRYEKNELGQKAAITILTDFGYTQSTTWTPPKPTTDKE